MMAPELTVDTVLVDDLWDLDARPGRLLDAAGVWRAVGHDAAAALELLDTAARPVTGAAWTGEAADSYQWHRGKLGRDLDTVARLAPTTAGHYEAMAALLRRGQGLLDDGWSRIAALVPHRRTGGGVAFSPADAAQADAVGRAVADAAAIRAEVAQAVAGQDAALRSDRSGWAVMGNRWSDVAAGQVGGWIPPAEAGAGVDVILAGDGSVMVNATGGDDVVTVRTAPDGSRIVLVDGVPVRVPAGARLVVRTGAGNDHVTVDGDGAVTVLGGTGDDTLRGGGGGDTLLAGAGEDEVSAGGGDDLVSLGPWRGGETRTETADLGAGDDRLWGSPGDERVDGGDGDDLLFTGDGTDIVTAGRGDDTVDGGDGEDVLRGGAGEDVLFGAAAADYLDGGDGNDHLDGGDGDDTVYGLSGDDTLVGAAGSDYLEGGTGDDVLDGGTGLDILSGGRGDDVLTGGADDDVMYSGGGADAVHGGAGVDTLYGRDSDTADGVEQLVAAPAGPTLDGFVRIEGDAEYRQRVQADLDMLAASPDGRQMLAALQATGAQLVIQPEPGANAHALPGPPTTVLYNPAWDDLRGGAPPVVALFHELAHVYDYTHSTFNTTDYNGASGRDVYADGHPVINYERQATGLPIDDDGDPATANRIDPQHPVEFTENGLRAELHLPRRDTYANN